MPASATTIGSTIASTEPNAMSRIKIAARMPMPSPESDGRSDCWMSWPPSRTSSCGVECCSARSIICEPTEFEMFCALSSSCAFASATVPDCEIEPGVVYGLLTLTTCGTPASARLNSSTCVRTAASCIDGVPWYTTWTASPDCALKLARSRSAARVDSVLGALKLVLKFVPVTDASTLTPISAASHRPTTRRRRRWQKRASARSDMDPNLGWGGEN